MKCCFFGVIFGGRWLRMWLRVLFGGYELLLVGGLSSGCLKFVRVRSVLLLRLRLMRLGFCFGMLLLRLIRLVVVVGLVVDFVWCWCRLVVFWEMICGVVYWCWVCLVVVMMNCYFDFKNCKLRNGKIDIYG